MILLLLASCEQPESAPTAPTEVTNTEGLPTIYRDTLMYVFGAAKDYTTGDTLRDYMVVAWDVNDKAHGIDGKTTRDGRYDLILNKPGYYAIEYAAKGYAPKVVEIDMRIADSLLWDGGYGMNVNTTLVPLLEGLDAASLPTVVGRAHYDSTAENFAWDLDYTEMARARQDAVLKAYEKRKRPTQSR
ncbi:MAG: hypothetical protein WAU70_09375 [Flavobacteriales bacterium]